MRADDRDLSWASRVGCCAAAAGYRAQAAGRSARLRAITARDRGPPSHRATAGSRDARLRRHGGGARRGRYPRRAGACVSVGGRRERESWSLVGYRRYDGTIPPIPPVSVTPDGLVSARGDGLAALAASPSTSGSTVLPRALLLRRELITPALIHDLTRVRTRFQTDRSAMRPSSSRVRQAPPPAARSRSTPTRPLRRAAGSVRSEARRAA